MKNKHILWIFASSVVCNIIGALLKLMHWSYGTVFIMIALFLFLFSGLLAIVKTLKSDKVQSFLDK